MNPGPPNPPVRNGALHQKPTGSAAPLRVGWDRPVISPPPRWRLSFVAGLALQSIAGPGLARGATPEPPPVRFPVVFFAPAPPVYGARVAAVPSGTPWLYQGRRLVPPEGLGDLVGEIFYPPLSTRLFAGALSRSLESRVEDYRNRRNGLVNELFRPLRPAARGHRGGARVRPAPNSPRRRPRSPRSTAEELRRDLVHSGLTGGVDWNAQRAWKLESFPPSRDWANREGEFQVVRAAAYFEDGLVPAQRGLLRELAADLAAIARKSRANPRTGPRAMPCTSRRKPRACGCPDLPPDLLGGSPPSMRSARP